MTTLGTNYVESINCTIAKFAPTRSDFSLTHWARVEIAIMNRTQSFGSLGVANRVRAKVGLEQLSQDAGKRVKKRDRRGNGVTLDQPVKTPEQKALTTARRHAKKSEVSDDTATVRQSSDMSTRVRSGSVR